MTSLVIPSKSQFSIIFKGGLIAAVIFIALGTITALWDNPFFFRMTPTSGFEIGLLLLQAIMFGIYFAMPSTQCAIKSLSTSGVLGFLGFACPVCNKILLYAFGSELLMAYLKPARIYLALIGTLVVGLALYMKKHPPEIE